MSGKGRFFELLAIRVAAGLSVSDAATVIGCSVSHGWRLSRRPDFAARVAELRTAATDRAVGALGDAALEAVQVLRSVMQDSESRNADRVAAAGKVLTLLAPLAELHELRLRLDRLEKSHQLRAVS